jgi:uncharacterized Zn finger protein
MGWYDGYYGFRPYVSVAQRRAKAKRELAKLEKKGHKASPVVIEGRKIATTFWGTAWCDNLESYSDFESRLPRGRTYVRNGSVCDLQVEPGKVLARVCGSELYRITIKIKPLADAVWKDVKRKCAGQIGSLVELLQGRLSKAVMEVVTGRDGGLFPKPNEIGMSCSCPDWAEMCKHVAAALYGIGARLDEQPELLFKLRQVDHLELIAAAGDAAPAGTKAAAGKKTIASDALADVFGIELDAAAPAPAAHSTAEPKPAVAPAVRHPGASERRGRAKARTDRHRGEEAGGKAAKQRQPDAAPSGRRVRRKGETTAAATKLAR